jgi:hypothetical protein
MRTLLRHMATGQYFQSVEKWTPDRDDAYDFGVLAKAVKVARKIRIPGLELVLWSDGSDQAAATPFENFLLGLKKKRRIAGSTA